jgi:ABC-2 type transport system ATP-binding protein
MLRLSSVARTYPGGIAALRDVNLDVPRGLFGLLGPNGAGKSTLMRTIATLQAPDTGAITFDGIDALRDKTALRKVLGYLPQEFGAYPGTSAERMLRHFAALKGIHGRQQRQVVEHLLVKTNLWEARHRSVDTFSGGMKQRYGIAQALVGSPRLLIVDEPTAGLDPAERRRFQNLLAEVGEDVVVILSTHIVDDVADLCPRLAIMGQGRILEEGEADALVAALRGRVWTTLVPRDETRALQARFPVLASRLKGRSMEVRVLADAQPDAMSAAAPTLEDVYFATLLRHGMTAHLD